MLLAELAVGLLILHRPLQDILIDRDPVSGTAYYLALGLFALMPLLVRRR